MKQSQAGRASPSKKSASGNLTDQAYRRLEEMIATLELAPGTLVSEAGVSKLLGIGRMPVREAMQRLARERLLQIVPKRGCIVTVSKPGEELSVIEARRAIEPLVAQAAALRSDPDQRRTFEHIADALRQAFVSDDFDAFARLDAEFNELCLAACRNETAASMMQLIGTLNRRFWYGHHGRTLPEEGVESHIEIARAIARGDADGAIKNTKRLHDYIEGLVLPRARPRT